MNSQDFNLCFLLKFKINPLNIFLSPCFFWEHFIVGKKETNDHSTFSWWHYLFSVSLAWKPVQWWRNIRGQMIRSVGREKKTTWIGILWIMDQQLNAWNSFKGEKTRLLFWLLALFTHFFTLLSAFFILFLTSSPYAYCWMIFCVYQKQVALLGEQKPYFEVNGSKNIVIRLAKKIFLQHYICHSCLFNVSSWAVFYKCKHFIVSLQVE